MINKALVVQKLREIRDNMLEIKQKGVGFSDSAEFSSWRDTVTRWLKLGLPHTQDELKKFQYHLYFTVPRAQISDEDCYDYEDQSAYEKACDQTISLLGFAIENIEMGLIPESPEQRQPLRTGRTGSRQSGVNIGQAGAVVLGDKNVVSVVDSITVQDLWSVLEKEVEAKVTDVEQRKGLLQKLKELSKNPTFTTILGQGLGQVLRGYFGAH